MFGLGSPHGSVRGREISVSPKPMARSLAAHDVMHGAGFAGGKHDPVASLIMCAPSVGWVDMSVINGEIVVKDGKLQTLDMQVLIHPSPRGQAHVMLHDTCSMIAGELLV